MHAAALPASGQQGPIHAAPDEFVPIIAVPNALGIPLYVEIDVFPGDPQNTLIAGSEEGIPVAILSSPDFDAAQINAASHVLRLEDDGLLLLRGRLANGLEFSASAPVKIVQPGGVGAVGSGRAGRAKRAKLRDSRCASTPIRRADRFRSRCVRDHRGQASPSRAGSSPAAICCASRRARGWPAF